MWTLVLIIGLTGSTAGLYPTEQDCLDGIRAVKEAYQQATRSSGNLLAVPTLTAFCFKSATWR